MRQTTLEDILNEMDDQGDEDEQENKGYEQVSQTEVCVTFEKLDHYKNPPAPAFMPMQTIEPTIFSNEFLEYECLNAGNPWPHIDLASMTGELQWQMQGHLDEYREILGWSKAEMQKVSSLISTYKCWWRLRRSTPCD